MWMLTFMHVYTLIFWHTVDKVLCMFTIKMFTKISRMLEIFWWSIGTLLIQYLILLNYDVRIDMKWERNPLNRTIVTLLRYAFDCNILSSLAVILTVISRSPFCVKEITPTTASNARCHTKSNFKKFPEPCLLE